MICVECMQLYYSWYRRGVNPNSVITHYSKTSFYGHPYLRDRDINNDYINAYF